MSTWNNVLVDDALPAVIVTMNRPEQRNALSMALMSELIDAIEAQSRLAECRVMAAPSGCGSKAACAAPVRRFRRDTICARCLIAHWKRNALFSTSASI